MLLRSEFPRWKRGLDIIACVLGIGLFAPLTVTMVVFIKLVSRGPVLFRQERIGFRGQRFICYKFRTMQAGASAAGHEAHLHELMSSGRAMVKLDAQGDARLIPGARWLRASGLDELPQLFNVLTGSMSLVGPRPCLPYEYERYELWQKERFHALPGLTGLWQVNGKNRTTFDEMIRMDIHYGRHCSFWLDLRIILRTLFALLSQVRESRQRMIAATTRAHSYAGVGPGAEGRPEIG